MDNICEGLTKTKWGIFNPHKNMFGLGNYDVNVIEKVLDNLGFKLKWFDMRGDVKQINILADNSIFGLVVNVKVDSILKCTDSHWLAIKVIEGKIYNLDSQLD